MRWAPLHWIDTDYEISDTGLIRCWSNHNGGRCAAPHFVKTQVNKKGYGTVMLYVIAGPRKMFKIHRLVLQAFKGTVGPEVNHRNGIKLDNRLNNLEWMTHKENVIHSFKVLGRIGSGNGKKKVLQLTMSGGLVYRWNSLTEPERLGHDHRAISAVCRGLLKQHHGFKWQYVA